MRFPTVKTEATQRECVVYNWFGGSFLYIFKPKCRTFPVARELPHNNKDLANNIMSEVPDFDLHQNLINWSIDLGLSLHQISVNEIKRSNVRPVHLRYDWHVHTAYVTSLMWAVWHPCAVSTYIPPPPVKEFNSSPSHGWDFTLPQVPQAACFYVISLITALLAFSIHRGPRTSEKQKWSAPSPANLTYRTTSLCGL